MDALLSKLYYDPETGFTGVDQLYKRSKIIDKSVTRAVVKQWLEKVSAYTLHKPALKKYGRNRVIVSGIDEQWTVDLADLQSLRYHNDGYKYLFNCIDIFSKYAWSVPTKTKNAQDILDAFKHVLTTSKRKPQKLQADAGSEFTNKDFQKFLKSEYIEFFTTKSEIKSSVIERFNRTLKERMWRYFSKTNTMKYIDILPKLMINYNNSYHRTIKTFPANVTQNNEREILIKAFSIAPLEPSIFKFNINDRVRISKVKKHFEKGYFPKWSEEFFIIKSRLSRRPPVYTIKDQDGEIIEGVFYEPELQKVDIGSDDLFIIEKIIKTRKRGGKTDYFVYWRGYPSKFDSWVSDLIKV